MRQTPVMKPGLRGRWVALKERHRALDSAITKEQRRPRPDGAALKLMKRRRLALKDRMAALQAPAMG